MENETATSPATNGDANGSDGLTLGQAAARLFANAEKTAPATNTQATAAVETTQATTTAEQSEATTTAEAEAASVDTESTEQAAPEETQAEATQTEGEGDEVLSPNTLDEKLKAKIQKRIDKEVGKRKALESRIAELESRQSQSSVAPQQAPIAPVVALPDQPLAHIQDIATLQQHQISAKQALRVAEAALEDPKLWKQKTDIDPDTGEEVVTRTTTIGQQTYTEADLKAAMRRARIDLEDNIPQRAEFLRQRDHARNVARQEFEFLNDKTSPEYQQVQAMLRDPFLAMRPDAEWIAAVQIEGLRALEAKKTAAKKTAEAPTKPKAPAPKPSSDQTAVSASTTATRVSSDTAQRLAAKQERERLMGKGGVSAAEAAAFLQRNRISRNAR